MLAVLACYSGCGTKSGERSTAKSAKTAMQFAENKTIELDFGYALEQSQGYIRNIHLNSKILFNARDPFSIVVLLYVFVPLVVAGASFRLRSH